MSRYEQSVSLHQQDGGMSLQAFAEKQGISENYLRRLIKKGLVLGASKHPLSKKWCIYPPARIADGSCMVRPTIRKPREKVSSVRAGESVEGFVMSGVPLHHQISATADAAQREQEGQSVGDFGQPAPQVKPEGSCPPARRSFNAVERCAAVGAVALTSEQRETAMPDVYASPEAKRIRQVLQEAAARMHREGIHYLHLDSREFSQLYAALDHERSRIRKLVGKGLVDVGNLRASDSVWQKLQVVCHEGRLL